ncbi:hypothetical protein [Desulfobotulus mexicanus]|uniref:Uncharacterized protein n=1 Tax=Desulfobotulus mexicanus TaxID=2586642 RepID=A0A5Q4VFB2_9BACT|nr:hypothetical protein [Desulfobotulus mexicanus]TYT74952.1 hypothetical protein FIM25_07460 [Desulfobotulus mexicanus]
MKVVATLVILGVLASVAGFGLVRVVEGYMFTRENTEITQKAQLALNRMNREIIELLDIEKAEDDSIALRSRDGLRSFGFDDNRILFSNSNDFTDGDVLAENISALNFQYYSGSSAWDKNDVSKLTLVEISMIIQRSDGTTMPFVSQAAPRNNKIIEFETENPEGTPGANPQIPDFNYKFCMIDSLIVDNGDMQLKEWLWLCIIFMAITGWWVWFKSNKGGTRMNEKGSLLLGLVVTIVVIAALTAAIVPMFTSSTMGQVVQDQGRKAFFLAESGFRFAASSFLKAGDEDKRLEAISNMHGKTYTMKEGSFQLAFETYWFKAKDDFTNDTDISLDVHGRIPSVFQDDEKGWVELGNQGHPFTVKAASGKNLVFTIENPVTVKKGDDIRLASDIKSAGKLSKGESLLLDSDHAWALPDFNGNFVLRNSSDSFAVFNYERLNRATNTLERIRQVDPREEKKNWSVDLNNNTYLVLEPYVRVFSAGIVGNSQREVVYNAPVGWIAGGSMDEFKREIFHETFGDTANWFAGSAHGGHKTVNIDGAKALKITGVEGFSGTLKVGPFDFKVTWTGDGLWNMLALNWVKLRTNLFKSWQDHKGALSYDLQIKVKNDQPYFMAGMGFRMKGVEADENGVYSDLETYGVSFIRQRQRRDRYDGIMIGAPWWRDTGDWTYHDGIAAEFREELKNVLSFNGLDGVGANDSRLDLGSRYGWFDQYQETYIYSDPAMILWQRKGKKFNVLAVKKLADGADNNILGLTNGLSGKDLRLKDWSTLMVRIMEGWELTFEEGTNHDDRFPKRGDILQGENGNNARITGMPVLKSGSWGAGDAEGVLLVSGMEGDSFSAGDKLSIRKGDPNSKYLTVETLGASKVNWIMVYAAAPQSSGTANAQQTDTYRLGNPRSKANWPPDDWADRSPENDFFTLIKWDTLSGVTPVPAEAELAGTIIRTSTILSPDFVDNFDPKDFKEAITILTSSSAGTSTYYDDFAIQLDQKAGTGFLPPIQQ